MLQKTSVPKLSDAIHPLCPRDSRLMRYDKKGFESHVEDELLTLPCYRCDHQDCSLRYTPLDGYFTVIMMPDLGQPVEEPGINLLQCPRHEAWLYRCSAENSGEGLVWKCGVADCDYAHADCGPVWPSL